MNVRVSPGTLLLLPLAGMVVFVVLYIVAARLYPGGSNADPSYTGFDWVNNYWCDLIARYGKNGEPNTGRPVALAAMIILFSSLSVFWFRLPDFFRETRFSRLLIGYTGMTAMCMLVFIFTKYHDTIIFIGGSLSSIPFIGTLRELFINRWRFLFVLGCFCLVLILFNFYSYLSGWLIAFLPLIQKITLVFFLAWMFLINWNCILLLLKNRVVLNRNRSYGKRKKSTAGLTKVMVPGSSMDDFRK
jgi:hypothetical protein